jgi:hypothetical protein
MFGKSCAPTSERALFHWVWLYKIKTNVNNLKKARAGCDASTRGGQVQVKGQTYAPTPDMTDLRLLFALAALQNKLVFGADVSNAFAEADSPKQAYSMRVDPNFANGGLTKAVHRSLPVMLFPFSKIYRAIRKLLDNSPNTLMIFFKNSLSSLLSMHPASIGLPSRAKPFSFYAKLTILLLN